MAIPHVEKGDPPEADAQNRLIDQSNRVASPGSTGPMHYGPGGAVGFVPFPKAILGLFELTSAVTMPDIATAETSYFNLEPTPYASAQRILLHQYDSTDEDADGMPIRSYETNDSYQTIRLYFPLCFRNDEGYAIGHPPLANGDRCWARLCKGRWEALKAPLDVWRFELKDTLEVNSGATAYLLEWNGSAYAKNEDIEFEVYDAIGVFSGVAEAKGYAKFMPDRGVWEIIQLTCP